MSRIDEIAYAHFKTDYKYIGIDSCKIKVLEQYVQELQNEVSFERKANKTFLKQWEKDEVQLIQLREFTLSVFKSIPEGYSVPLPDNIAQILNLKG